MRIKVNSFIIFFTCVLTVVCFSLKITWAVPASFQAVQDLKDNEKQAPAMFIEVPRVEYTASSQRDPFEPEPAKEEDDEDDTEKNETAQTQSPLPNLDVQGIIWGSQLPQAIINNQVVKIGDLIKGVRIVDISKKGITIFYNGHQQVIAAPAVNMLEEQIPQSQRRSE